MSQEQMLQIILNERSRKALNRWVNVLNAKYQRILTGAEWEPFTNAHLPKTDYQHHVTLYHPHSCPEDKRFFCFTEKPVNIYPTGYVRTSYVEVLTVVVKFGEQWFQHQAGGRRLLHITLGCAPGVKPVAANDAILTNPVSPTCIGAELVGKPSWIDV